MGYILDGVVIIIFLLAVFMGYRRGFFKSIIQLAGCVAAVVIAFSLSAPIAGGIYDVFISKSVENSIVSSLDDAGVGTAGEALDEVLGDLPGPVRSALTLFNLGTPEEIQHKLSGSLDSSIEHAASSIEQQVIRPVAVSLLRVLCIFILFVVLMIAVGIVASVVGRIFKLPMLRQADGALGAALGAVQGVVFVFVAVTVMSLIAASSDGDGRITRQKMNDTLIVHSVERSNPLTTTLYSMFGANFV